MTLRVEQIDDPNQFAGLREEWNKLALKTESAQFFQTHDWLTVYWKHYGQDQRMRILLVRDNDRIIGIVPLVIRYERRQVGNLATLTYPLDDWGSFYHPITTDAARTMSAVVHYLNQNQKDWQLLSWRWCDSNHPATTAIEAAMADAGMRTFDSVRETSAIIDLPPSYDDYLAQRGSKFRNNVKRWTRRRQRIGRASV